MLDFIEHAGNKVPRPAVLFFLLIVSVLLSHLFQWLGASVTYERINTGAAAHIRVAAIGGRYFGYLVK